MSGLSKKRGLGLWREWNSLYMSDSSRISDLMIDLALGLWQSASYSATLDILKRNAIEILGLKYTVTELNTIDGPNIRLGTANSRGNELEDRSVQNIHTEVISEGKEWKI